MISQQLLFLKSVHSRRMENQLSDGEMKEELSSKKSESNILEDSQVITSSAEKCSQIRLTGSVVPSATDDNHQEVCKSWKVGSDMTIDDKELCAMNIPRLNEILRKLPLDQASSLKTRRRQLRNRVHAKASRSRRLKDSRSLQKETDLLKRRLDEMQKELAQQQTLVDSSDEDNVIEVD